jgi:hypothetical protein
MLSIRLRQLVALSVTIAMFSVAIPAWGAPVPATLTGTVFGPNASAPLAGATVVVTAADGTKLASQPTGADGAFTVQGVPPGTQTLALETKDGAFAIATPITLAPGQTRGVQLALKAASTEEEKKKKKGAAAVPPSSAATGAMIATIVGFAVIGGLAVTSINDDNKNNGTASPSQPPPDGK